MKHMFPTEHAYWIWYARARVSYQEKLRHPVETRGHTGALGA